MDQHQHTPASGLERFVNAARSQPIARTSVTAEAVAAGLEHHRRRSQSRRTVLLSAAMAAAATLLAVGLLGPLLAHRGPAAVEQQAVDGSRSELGVSRILDDAGQPYVAPTLAYAVHLRSTSDVEVRGPWTIGLRDGNHEIEVESGAGVLRIELPSRTLELVEGRASVDLVDGEVAVRLHTGVAAWVDESGARTQIHVERIELDSALGSASAGDQTPTAAARSPTATASELARTAERLLADGRRNDAIATYRELARKHPQASQTRTGLLDLARLLRVDGRKDEARCAYRLHLARWPDSSVRVEVESQLARLGEGPSCRGLSPQ